MLLNFPKTNRGTEKDSEYLSKDIVEANLLNQSSKEQLDERQLPPLTEGRVAIHFTSATPDGGALIVGFYISNGFSKKVKFKNISLVLLDSNKQVLAQQSFRGETIGVVAGRSAKACVVRFEPDNVYVKDVPSECEVCFDVRDKRPKKVKIGYQTLPKNISLDQQQKLEQILAKLPPMKHGEVDFSRLCAKVTAQNELLATVIIRNSMDKPINLEKMPLIILDANQKELARGIFDVKNIIIKPYKAILWTFKFQHIFEDSDVDLSTWHIVLNNNSSH
ncbi:SLAP domain-containing protein [Desulfosporosinus hippei]|uniref:SLAP domain-containing protein n=1 Tax=Desulfosporosinus hippei DSM 8344 TaxID=1121419 RepID=A0A1G8HHI9_9FIRM|nr:SLAP domain-containing protein [Desulfosporosinus hippei]SDI06123.1 SLAP domain-containing protein [Desulfosporosinus hippei DSM 8344]